MATITETLRRTPLAGPDDRRCLPHGLFGAPNTILLIPPRYQATLTYWTSRAHPLAPGWAELFRRYQANTRCRTTVGVHRLYYNPMERVVSNAAHYPFRAPDSSGSLPSLAACNLV